ncbi:MAG: IscS subfamily cysteine desulfurase [Candidatus Omnitrophica bacterium]|nr:IscS subfamily cysteine desulfurase [Candidatus Omnitrophota bacterium]
MKLPIYMDYQSTTPVDPRVLEAMLPYYREGFGNAASRNHAFGQQAHEAVEEARAQIARFINASEPSEVIFTSGATESNNLALKGIAEMYRERGNHIVTSQIEHKSVLDSCRFLESKGFHVTYLPVNQEGLIHLKDLREAMTQKTILVSVMHANNEVGVLEPIEEVGKIAKEHNIFFHTDAVQSVGKVPFDVQAMEVDLASISAHKIYGPKGIGVLYLRKRNPRARLESIIHGGGHEGGLRSGTLNVPAIVGFGKACEIAAKEMNAESKKIFALREKLRSALLERLGDIYVNGSLEQRIPGNLNVSFAFVEGESLLNEMSEEVAVSSGAACSSAALEPSYVLKALGVGEDRAHTSIRFGLGRFTTDEEVNYTIDRVVKVVKRLRAESPIYQSESGREFT